jgi:hypothetical protein
MKSLLERLGAFLRSRTGREQWVLGLAGLAFALTILHIAVLRPLRAGVAGREAEVARLLVDVQKAVRLARGVQQLDASVRQVDARITTSAKTNLFTLLESLAQQAQVKDRLESIKPKQASGNALYPETRVEVTLKGATDLQTVELLYRIETAPAHLIIRSLRIKSRPDGSNLLDVSMLVSSFERA